MRINIYKREGKKGTRWYLDYFWGGRRWRYPVADTRKTADEIKARIQVQVAEGTFKGPRRQQYTRREQEMTFGQLCEDLLETKRPSCAKATVEFYEGHCRLLRAWFKDSTPIGSIGPRECERCDADRRTRRSPVSGRSDRRKGGQLHAEAVCPGHDHRRRPSPRFYHLRLAWPSRVPWTPNVRLWPNRVRNYGRFCNCVKHDGLRGQ